MGKDTRTKEQVGTDSTELIVGFRNFANAPKNDVEGNSLVHNWSSVTEGSTINKTDINRSKNHPRQYLNH